LGRPKRGEGLIQLGLQGFVVVDEKEESGEGTIQKGWGRGGTQGVQKSLCRTIRMSLAGRNNRTEPRIKPESNRRPRKTVFPQWRRGAGKNNNVGQVDLGEGRTKYGRRFSSVKKKGGESSPNGTHIQKEGKKTPSRSQKGRIRWVTLR